MSKGHIYELINLGEWKAVFRKSLILVGIVDANLSFFVSFIHKYNIG